MAKSFIKYPVSWINVYQIVPIQFDLYIHFAIPFLHSDIVHFASSHILAKGDYLSITVTLVIALVHKIVSSNCMILCESDLYIKSA